MTTHHARAPLAVRLIIAALAALLIVVASLAAINLSAAAKFNQATQSLNANIQAAQDESTDVDTLNASQQQTDAQFAEAGSMRAVLLPQIRDAIDANAQLSQELTRITLERAEQLHNGGTDGQTQSGQSGQSSDNKSTGGLSEEQRQQVEELMQANKPSTSSDNDGTTSRNNQDQQSGTTSSNGEAKPW
ncbi:DUF6466 family protein [Bifidobacterium oedipodis]|uniref:Cell surface protein n=1 Tax=Bifidobacterium oedipodis TaxID=2675322 RepID=A0A7Y0HSJ1_9BIFI|nr:DUF6466 family protein [Bifidobacterium sp. DSM 109957]NMM93648.1 cell surface protein [Bifidobacterium sp. DSM 109957]